MTSLRGPLVLGGLLFLLACDGGSGITGPRDPEDLIFHISLGVDLDQMTKTASGLYYQDLVVGTGYTAQEGDDITAHYTGWLHNGVQFDSSYDRGRPLEATLSFPGLIRGWVEGIPGMKEGGKRKLVIPYSLGYGSSGSQDGTIPPYATLVFDVELLEVGGQ